MTNIKITYNQKKNVIRIYDSCTGRYEVVQVALRNICEKQKMDIVSTNQKLAAHILFQASPA